MSENETKEPELETMFLVHVYKDGRIATFGEMPEETPTVQRVANNFDVYQKCKEIVDEFEQGMLAQRVASEVIQAMAPQAAANSEKIAEALRERGITPEA